MLMYLLRTQLSIPYEEVGRLIGSRDHSTVMHAVNKITQLATTDVHIREDMLKIKTLYEDNKYYLYTYQHSSYIYTQSYEQRVEPIINTHNTER